MAFANWKTKKQQSAIAIVAISAIDRQQNSFDTEKNTPSIATIASIAIAGSENPKKSEPTTQTKPLPQSPFLGGSDSVIIANSTNAQAANDPPPKGEVKPVIQKTIRQSLAAQIEPLKEGADLNYSLENQVKNESYSQTVDGRKKPLVNPQIEDGQLNRKSADKPTTQNLGDALKTEPTPQIEDASTDKRKISFNLDDYRHLVTCNQCEHLSLTGSCKRLDKRVIPEAMRECDSFKLLKSKRLSIVKVAPYATAELLTHYEKPLFNHLLACPYCHVLRGEYCINGYAMGSVYDALLLNRDDAQARRESLALRVDRACISGRRAFTAFNPTNAPPPPNTAFQTRKYGNTHEYETFINHWTACKVCKPNLGRYCSEGQRLEVEANSSYS